MLDFLAYRTLRDRQHAGATGCLGGCLLLPVVAVSVLVLIGIALLH